MAIRVLIVDDSATAREVLKLALQKDPQIEVIGTAADAYVARDKIVSLKPDVVCLDVEMPRMDGVTFLKKLMSHFPVRVLMVSSLTQKGAKITLEALEYGAIDFVSKPHQNIYGGIEKIEKELITKVKTVANSSLISIQKKQIPKEKQQLNKSYSLANTTNKIIAIGSSTGGTVALTELIKEFPRDIPGTVVVQHMPAGFTNSFANRLNEISQVEVSEAKDGDTITKGRVYIANGDYHMVVRREGGNYKIKLGTGEKVSGHCPSVDVLFNSVSKYVGANAIGVILTGMGSDGAKGLLKMKNAGAKTIGQDEKSCVVYGMPKIAYEIGAVQKQLPLEKIAREIIQTLNQMEQV